MAAANLVKGSRVRPDINEHRHHRNRRPDVRNSPSRGASQPRDDACVKSISVDAQFAPVRLPIQHLSGAVGPYKIVGGLREGFIRSREDVRGKHIPLGSQPPQAGKSLRRSETSAGMVCSAVARPLTSASAWVLITSMIFSEFSPGKEAHSVTTGNWSMLVWWFGFFS